MLDINGILDRNFDLMAISLIGLFAVIIISALVTSFAVTSVATKFLESCSRQPDNKKLFTECLQFCALAEAFAAIGIALSVFIVFSTSFDQPNSIDIDAACEAITELSKTTP